MPPRFGEDKKSGIAGMLMRLHIAHNEKQAQAILAVFTVVCISLAVWLMLPGKSAPQNNVQQNPNYEPKR